MEIIIILIVIGIIFSKLFTLIEIAWYLFHCLTFGKLLESKDKKETYHSLGVGLYIMIFFIAFIVLVIKFHSVK